MIRLDREESQGLVELMRRAESMPPEERARAKAYLEYCAASAVYCVEFGHMPDWWVRDDLYDHPSPF